MHLNNKWLIVVKVCGGILFAVQGFFFFLFMNWPFGTTGVHSYLPFIALALSMSGYLAALKYGRLGGSLMITGILILAINGFIASGNNDIKTKLVIALVTTVPVIIIGLLFMLPVIKK